MRQRRGARTKTTSLELEDGRELRGDHLLVATGRRPRVDGLGLETVGIDADARGVPVDERLRVGERLWAIGDVNGTWPLTHVGKYEGEVVAANILGEPREADYEAVPRVVFTDPQAASVGATEAPFSATAPVSQVAKMETYTRAYAESNGFLTLLSDERAAHRRVRARPRGRRVAATGHGGDPCSCAARGAAGHHPALPDLLGDLRRRAESPSRRGHGRAPAREDGAMTTEGTAPAQREPELLGQTVVVIGGSAGIGLETARRARAEGADVVLTGRDPERLKNAASELGAIEHRGL